MNVASPGAAVATPFDQGRVDAIMDAHGVDVLLATSKHNCQYLLGGYRFIFFSAMDAIGHSRYLPVVIYRKGAPHHAGYVGNRMEAGEHQVNPFWTPAVETVSWGSVDAIDAAAAHVRRIGMDRSRIGYEPSFLPVDAWESLRRALPEATFVPATGLFERVRAIKSAPEIELLRKASELITDSMLAVFSAMEEGDDKAAIVDRLRQEETRRGLQFEYCLITIGASHNRAVSPQRWNKGEVLSLDSGGNYRGYIGDLCRMGVLGEPDAELDDILAEIEAVQQAAFSKCRPGIAGRDMIEHAERALRSIGNAAHTDFFAHGMGLITHEVPFLMTNHPVAYEGTDADLPLEEGMVLSVETTMLHPRRGFIKLEDTVALTADGHELLGNRGRGWNRG